MVGRGCYPGCLWRQQNNQGVTSSASHETGFYLNLFSCYNSRGNFKMSYGISKVLCIFKELTLVSQRNWNNNNIIINIDKISFYRNSATPKYWCCVWVSHKRTAGLMWLCGPHHHKKPYNLAEIVILCGIKASFTFFCGPQRPFSFLCDPRSHFMSKCGLWIILCFRPLV